MSDRDFLDDEELTRTAAERLNNEANGQRPHVRRRKTMSDYITTTSALLGALAAVAVFMGSLTDALPFVQKTPYIQDMVEVEVRFQKVESSTQTLNASMEAIQHNGLLTLQLQLQQRVDALTDALKTIPPNTQNYYQIGAARNEAQQQLEEIKRQLGR